jgi:hypothetical protein
MATDDSIWGTPPKKEDTMGLLKGAFKAGIAMKAIDVVRREASKPENRAKAKEMFAKFSNRSGKTRH